MHLHKLEVFILSRHLAFIKTLYSSKNVLKEILQTFDQIKFDTGTIFILREIRHLTLDFLMLLSILGNMSVLEVLELLIFFINLFIIFVFFVKEHFVSSKVHTKIMKGNIRL